jgi:nucleoside-diphosphate-sugar epimerase
LLVASGEKVRVFDLPKVSWDSLSSIDNIEIFKGDITDINIVKDAIQGVDVIIHLAAILPPQSEVNKFQTFNVNIKGTMNLVDVVKTQLLIFASSISTYGITSSETSPISELHSQHGHNIYSESKILSEKKVLDSGIQYVILRVAPIAIADLLELPEVIPYKANQRVEFIDIRDAALAFYHSSIYSEAKNKILNISGGKSWQMTGSEYINNFYTALGIDIEPTFSNDYSAIDWYDTKNSQFLNYQKTSFIDFQRQLNSVALDLGLK